MKTKMIWIGIPAILFIIIAFWLVIFFMPLLVICSPGMYLPAIIGSGFANPSINESFIMFISIFSFLIGLSILVPQFRKMYYTFPWLYPYVKVLFIDYIICILTIMIVNFGYTEDGDSRKLLFKILAILFLIVARLVQCVYFKYRKSTALGGQ